MTLKLYSILLPVTIILSEDQRSENSITKLKMVKRFETVNFV